MRVEGEGCGDHVGVVEQPVLPRDKPLWDWAPVGCGEYGVYGAGVLGGYVFLSARYPYRPIQVPRAAWRY